MGNEPTGTIAVLFTDIEGSTRLWATEEQAMASSLALHDEIVRSAVTAHGGVIFSTGGDGFGIAFERPSEAVATALEVQARIAGTRWPTATSLRVRMGIHVGEVEARAGDYFGHTVNLAARVASAGHGGQVLVTSAMSPAIGMETIDLGEFRLRDIPEPVRIRQLGVERFPRLRGVDPDRVVLPRTGPIIGRGDEIHRVRRLLVEHSLVTLTGVGGSGKTRLAIEVASEEVPGREGGVYFVDLSAFASSEEVGAAVAEAVGLHLTVGDAFEQVLDYLADKSALVVLDNCEHVLDPVAELAGRFCVRAGPARLLATSRELLDVPGEYVVAVEPLSADSPDAPAVQLLLARAAEAGAAVDDPSHREALAELCRRLDGMPLAIELAAARLAVLSPVELLDRLEERFRLLTGGRRRNRTRTLEAAIDWSYDLLDEDDKKTFRSLGVFSDRFPLDAAAAVSQIDEFEALDRVGALVAKSMLVVERHGDRTYYRLLETLRAYALSKLDAAGEIERARDAHLRHYRHGGAPASRWLTPVDLADTAVDAANFGELLSAFEWAAGSARWRDAGDLAFRMFLGLATQPAMHGTVLERLDRVIDALPDDDQARTLLRTARLFVLGNVDAWGAALPECFDLADADEPAVSVVANAFLGFVLWVLDDLNGAEACTERAAAIETDRGPSGFGDFIDWVRGSLAIGGGDFDAAEEAFACGVERDVGVEFGIHRALCAVSLATMQVINGAPAAALDTLARYDWSVASLANEPVTRAAALEKLGRHDEARAVATRFARDVSLGRARRYANDGMIALGVVAERDEPACVPRLLREAAIPRNPHTLALSLDLASRVGCRAEIDEMVAGLRSRRERPDARAFLLAELERLDAL